MNQPPILPHIKRVRRIYREIEHLLGLLNGNDVGDHAHRAVGLLDLIPNLEMTCTHPFHTQVRMAFRLRPERSVDVSSPSIRGDLYRLR